MSRLVRYPLINFLSLVSLVLLCAMELQAQVPTFTGSEINSSFVPLAINDGGQMVGTVDAPAGGTSVVIHAALYENGVVTDLGVLPGGDHSEATGINNYGEIVGFSTTGSGVDRAFLYKNGVMTDLGTLPGGASSRAYDINDAGQITGYADTTQTGTSFPRPDHAFIYTNGVMTDIGNLTQRTDGSGFGWFSVGVAINNSGEVVGWSNDDNASTHAFMYTGGQMRDLGTLGGSESRATDINDSGTVVGWSFTSNNGPRRAFKVENSGAMTGLGALAGENSSMAKAITNNGVIVGSSVFNSTPAFVYTNTTGLVRLASYMNETGWFLSDAYLINNEGKIVARGSSPDVFATYFLLTPAGIVGEDDDDFYVPVVPKVVSLDGSPTSARFLLGAYLDGTSAPATSFRAGDYVHILGIIEPDSDHVGMNGALHSVDKAKSVTNKVTFSYRNTDGIFRTWNLTVPGLGPSDVLTPLLDEHLIVVYQGILAAGEHKIYIAYSTDSGKLIYSGKALNITITP